MSLQKAFTNKTIIVAGGTSGMGLCLVKELATYAKTILVLGRNEAAGERVVAENKKVISFRKLDLGNTNDTLHEIRQFVDTHGAIDYFFNFAGSFLAGELQDTPVEKWHAIYQNNITPIINGTTAVYEEMLKVNHGHIINVASAAGLFPVPVMNIYGSTKAAVISLTLGLAMEAKLSNIDVSVVCPTIVKTPLYDTAMYGGVDKDKALETLKNNAGIQTAEQAAHRIALGVAKKKRIIHTAFSTKFAWVVFRLSPKIYLFFAGRIIPKYRQSLRQS